MGEAKRVTCRNMRVTKRGTVTSAAHIDKRNDTPEKRAEVRISRCFDLRGRPSIEGDLTAHEADFYERHFRAGLDAQNERYRKKGNNGRVRTMDEYLKGQKTAPEDTLFYIGCMGNEAKPEDLLNAYLDFVEWRQKRFPCVKPLGFGLHKEEGAYHIEEHHVWVALDADGNPISDQGKALEQMGVKRPDLTKKADRYNNPKMSYTAECRAKWIEIAKGYGYDIIEEPRERGRSGLPLEAYITRQIREQREAELVDVTRAIVDAQRELGDLTEFRAWKADKEKAAREEASRKEQERQKAEKATEAARRDREAQEQAQREQAARTAAQAQKRPQAAQERQEAAEPQAIEDRYQAAMKAIRGPSAIDLLKAASRATDTAARRKQEDGPGYPGS